jgi:hypothetical protein
MTIVTLRASIRGISGKLAVVLAMSLLVFGMAFGSGIPGASAYLTPTSDAYGADASAGIYFDPYDHEGGAGRLLATASVHTTGVTGSSYSSANLHSIHVSLSGSGDIAVGQFYDTYAIQSTVLPLGSPAHVVITYDIQGTLTGSGHIIYYVYTGIPGDAGLTPQATDFIGAGTFDTGTQALNFDQQVGDSIVVEVQLECYQIVGTCSAADPLGVTSTTPGVTVTSAAQIAAPGTGVPEFGLSGTALMVGLGFIAVFLVKGSLVKSSRSSIPSGL